MHQSVTGFDVVAFFRCIVDDPTFQRRHHATPSEVCLSAAKLCGHKLLVGGSRFLLLLNAALLIPETLQCVSGDQFLLLSRFNFNFIGRSAIQQRLDSVKLFSLKFPVFFCQLDQLCSVLKVHGKSIQFLISLKQLSVQAVDG